MDLKDLHGRLGGDLIGNELRAPGPGRAATDRSLVIVQKLRGLTFSSPDKRSDVEQYIRMLFNFRSWEPGDELEERVVPETWVQQFDARVAEIERASKKESDP